MKDINELKFENTFKYTQDHEWAKIEGNKVRVGITDYAQDQLGDVVFVELPQVGDSFKKGEAFGTVESVKAVSEIYMPVSSEIIEINTSLEESPEFVNKEPYIEGWIIIVKPNNLSEFDELMDKDAYINMLKGND
ncbi:glycine cleavage system H protein [Candidatus Magnetomoraceae bacterium gMMP-15]